MAPPPFLELGGVTIHPLDGGRMCFDVEVLGRRRVIELAVRPLLVRAGGFSLLVDPGFGPADPGRRKRFELRDGPLLEEQCAELGLPQGPDMVVLTHLHFDHAAGALVLEGGEERARFPRARHLCHEVEWEAALASGRGGDLARRLEGALGRGAFSWVRGERGALLPGLPQLRFEKVRGHTEGLMVLEFVGREGRCFYPADLVPHRGFLRPKRDTLADLDPDLALREREGVLAEVARQGAYLWFYHDLEVVFGKLLGEKEGDVYRLEDLFLPREHM